MKRNKAIQSLAMYLVISITITPPGCGADITSTTPIEAASSVETSK